MGISHPDYTVVRELGQGASATVYLAVQNSLNRKVALKVLARNFSADKQFGERFLREGRIVAKLNHPHIVPVFDVEEHDGALFMAMEYLPGGTLSEQGPRMSFAEFFECIKQIASALGYAHEQGFVHRDIKPDNILFREASHAMVADFGIARATESLTRMTMTGAIIGTPAYMSPEQVTGESLDGRADLYSLGVMLYELVTGHQPFQGDSIMSVGLQHVTAPIPPLPDGCECFSEIITTLMAKKPADRFANVGQFLSAFQQVESTLPFDPQAPISGLHTGDAPSAVPLTEALARQPARKRRRWWPYAAAVGVLAAGAAYWLTLNDSEPVPDDVARADVGEPMEPEDANVENITEPLLAEARRAANAERWFGNDGAVVLYRQVLAEDPEDDDAIDGLNGAERATTLRAQLLINQGSFDEADELIEQIAAAWPDSEQPSELARRLADRRSEVERASAINAQQRRVSELLTRARAASRRGDLVEPEENNAVLHYRTALALDADNLAAQDGLDNVTEQLLSRAERAISANRFDQAQNWLDNAGEANGSYPRLQQVADRLQETRAIWAEQELRAEEQRQFSAKVDALRERISGWNPGSDAGENYENLQAEVSNLLTIEPENAALLGLRSMIEQRRQAQMLEESKEEDLDTDPFTVPVF